MIFRVVHLEAKGDKEFRRANTRAPCDFWFWSLAWEKALEVILQVLLKHLVCFNSRHTISLNEISSLLGINYSSLGQWLVREQ